MTHYLDIELNQSEISEMNNLSVESWFTAVDFRNAKSPRHPSSERTLDENNRMKKDLMLPWIRESVEDKRVLDLFCANGVFSMEAALAGAKEVVGIDFSPERIECARFLAGALESKVACTFDFLSGDVYELRNLVSEPFDVVLTLGGLYHVADPPHILSMVRDLTRERLILQTSSILPGDANQARFVVRKDKTSEGMTSIQGGRGAWHFTASCFEAIMLHSGFSVVESKRPDPSERERFPWYCAVAKPI